MFLKSLLLTSVALLSYLVFFGQATFPYDQEWKLIDSLMTKKNLPKSALVEVNKLYTAAKKEKQEAQWVKAIIYKSHLEEVDDNRNISLSIKELETEAASAPPRVAALLRSVTAEQLFQYLQSRSYQIGNRTDIYADTSSDITTWTTGRFNQRIRSLYLASIENQVSLQETKLEEFNAVLVKGNARELRPTLYDLLSWRALDYFRNDYSMQWSPADDSLKESSILFSEAPFFMHYGFSKADSLSNFLNAITIYQKLLKFHAKDIPPDAWIDADIDRIQFVYQVARMENKDSLYMNALGRITKQFGSFTVATRAWYLQAKWWADKATGYDPLRDSLRRYDNLKAVGICEEVLKHHDSGEGRYLCDQLLKNISRKSFTLNIEQVNLANLPFRALVTYKNVDHIYGRIIRIDDATKQSFERNNNDLKFWPKCVRMPFEKSFRQDIPDTRDYQQHRVEIKIDPLPLGQYALLTSSDSAFSDKAIMGLTTFFCSSIAFVQQDQDYFVLNRDSGYPMPGVRVKTFIQKYINGESIFRPGKNYLTDEHGYFHLSEKENSYQLKFEFYSGNDYLSNTNYINKYREDDDDEDGPMNAFEEDHMKDIFFTDRSIYRPGQVVYFKALLVTKDFKTKKYKVISGAQRTFYLKDANDQNIDSLVLKTNAFGSVQGSFPLPQGLLNGEFRIYDENSDYGTSFSVEEYKRPTFFVAYDSVRESYRIGDTIKLNGYAKAYAGNVIDGARLTYRVYREIKFPYPWMFRHFPSYSEAEIAHGESRTNALGNFSIGFPALHDRSINMSAKPVYTYRIETTVSDAGGESRSETISVSASYQSFEIISPLPAQSRFIKDSLNRIPVTTENASGIFVKEKLTLTIYPLEAPTRLIRERYWQEPDQFILSEPEYILSFPNDEYRNETDIQSWKQLQVVYSKSDSSNPAGYFSIDGKFLNSVKPGMYLFEWKGADKNGDEILDKRYIELTDERGRSGLLKYNIFAAENIVAAPGKILNLQTGSAAKDLFVIRTIQSTSDTGSKFSFYRMSQEIKKTVIEIKESDQGGFGIADVFVKNNRWFSTERTIYVPWASKLLSISYETWKDKTLPGMKDQWKIKIAGYKKEQVSAEVLTSMYDASLDQFRMHSWSPPDLYPVYNRRYAWEGRISFTQSNMYARPVLEIPSPPGNPDNYDVLIQLGFGNKPIMMQGIANDIEVARSKDLSGAMETVTEGYSTSKVNDKSGDMYVGKPSPGESDGTDIQIRKNFNETAFFQPDLKTDAEGNVEINFTMPDALTRWKWMVFANTKDLAFGYAEKKIVTQKELMVQANMPRFFREGDTMLLPVKIANLSSSEMKGTVQLEWLYAGNNQRADQAVGNSKASQSFSVQALQSGVVFFPAIIPAHFSQPLLYRIVAKTNVNGMDYSDGEENSIPVLSNRMLVTESLPLNLEGASEKHFTFEKLLRSNPGSGLQNQALTVEYTTNPAWYAVQSLPYLMEFPYECAEQTFNRFYANALAARIVRLSPAMEAIFKKWRNTDTAALLSNLQKNQELKSALLRETPWVLQAESETQQKKNLALLFDVLKMRAAMKSSLDKLQQAQSEGGGFAWFKGGREDRYITQYIVSGIGRLRKIKAIPPETQPLLDNISRSAIAWLDKEIKSDYDKREKSAVSQYLEPIQIQYLYMRSYFPDVDVPGRIFSAIHYYRNLSIDKWMKQPAYTQGMIALFLNRTGDIQTAKNILASLKENATISSETGMYWKTVRYGYYWWEAPVETQSVLIETFEDLHADQNSIDQMKYWLLQQKRTTHWPTTKSTADACYALLMSGSDWLESRPTVSIRLGDYKIDSSEEKTEAGTGYFRRSIPGDQVLPAMGNIQISLYQNSDSTAVRQSSANNPNSQNLGARNRQSSSFKGQRSPVYPSWGAVYWQYFENLEKITVAQTGLSINKQLFIEKNAGQGPVLEAVSLTNSLKPGDKLKMRIIIKSDRDLEYVHLKDMRAACLEPENVLSGYQWQGGLGYYQTTQDASTSFFFDRLPKGSYVFEYPVFVTTAGNYSNGISNIQCMYAPEFAAHSGGIRLNVESK